MKAKPIVWSIAGSDSSGASGMQVDIKTMNCLGVYVGSVITAVTAQSLTSVTQIDHIAPTVIRAQLEALDSQGTPVTVKLGMLGTGNTVRELARYFRNRPTKLVVDPVLRASAGEWLLDDDGRASLCQELLPMVSVITPNIPEAEILTGENISSREGVIRAAQKLRHMGAKAVVIKGGHAGGHSADDFVSDESGDFWVSGLRVDINVRGTGCVFASAIAAALALGNDLRDAIIMAKGYVSRGIAQGELLVPDRPYVLRHDCWPVEASFFPKVTLDNKELSGDAAFPPLADFRMGFYPIVPRASWIPLLAQIGVKTIQLRVKDLTDVLLEKEVAEAVRLGRECSLQLFINDYWDLAIKHGAYGVHLGQEDLATADLERIRKSGMRLGISTHSYFEAAVAHGIRPSYVALGPIFETTCKAMRFGPQGFSRVADWRQILPYPLVAIGGLKLEHLPDLKRLGVNGTAVISDWLYDTDPIGRARKWCVPPQ